MKTIDLTGVWDITDASGEYRLQGEVPGTVLYEMEKAGHFGENGAFYRKNNRKALSLMNRDFLYSKDVSIGEDFFTTAEAESRFFLEADGLDTLAEIKINGREAGRAANMHRSYRFDLEDMLHPGRNRIEIRFRNSLEYTRKEHERRPLMLEDPDGITTVPGFYSIRKSHCSYGWDWGPQMPDAGIWRALRLVRYDGCRFEDLRILQDHDTSGVTLSLSAELDNWSGAGLQITGSVMPPGDKEIPFSFLSGETCRIKIDNPRLWWPNGMGDQPLYRVRAELISKEKVFGTLEKKIGLRTLTISRKNDEWGESFNFEVNSVPVFARGANYIPEDVYLTRGTKEKTAKLLSDCCEAHFNCIRVWGGGVYPEDYFYELCDSLGLIIWQDLMFACAIYDIQNDRFVENISEEIRENLRRIRHHASLGLICGNNEMEWFFVDYDTFPQTKENEYEYIKQYRIVIPAIHEEICPEIFYWSSSPSSGGYFEEPNSPDKGDCHFWEVWHGNKDLSEYKKHYFRFMSEFGFESLPGIKTIESYTIPEDRNVFSPVMEEHQKRVGGNPKIVSYLSKYFRYPKDLESLAYVSQLSQSDAIRAGVEHWRRNRGRCMGSIYWQLNDNWPVASWSSIDYYGRWKSLHYTVKKVYDNILVSIDGSGKEATVHISNELRTPVSGTLSTRLYLTDGTLLNEEKRKVSVEGQQSLPVFTFGLEDSVAPDNALYHAVFECGMERYEAVRFFEIYKYLELQKPDIQIDCTEDKKLMLNSRKPAVYVEVRHKSGDCRFSDNYFHLFPGMEKEISILDNSDEPFSVESFRVRSLVDSY